MRMSDKDRITYRQSKKNPELIKQLVEVSNRLDRSLNYVVEQALLQYIKRNKK